MTLVRAALCAAALLVSLLPAHADTLRIATFNVELHRKGPGLLLRDIRRGTDPDIAAVISVITELSPDVLVLQGFDWDYDGAALTAFTDALRTAGAAYPHHFAARPNTGMPTDLDMDGDGRLGTPRDAQGFGYFSGQAGMALLSRHPIRADDVRDLSSLKWRDLPGALLPTHSNGSAFPSDAALDEQRLSHSGHWIVPVQIPAWGILQVLTFHAGPPVFDGPEDRNGRRNHDEIKLWQAVLDGTFGPPPTDHFVIAGAANLDPFDSDGRSVAIRDLLSDPRLQDPSPASEGAELAGAQGHIGPDALDTVDWPKVGRLRVDYVLPSRDWRVIASGVHWPAPDQTSHAVASTASRHRLVWVDLALD